MVNTLFVFPSRERLGSFSDTREELPGNRGKKREGGGQNKRLEGGRDREKLRAHDAQEREEEKKYEVRIMNYDVA
jgi:hypothetical protein